MTFSSVPEFGFPGTPGSITFAGSEASGEVQVTISILNGETVGQEVTIQLSAQLSGGDDNPAETS